MALFGFKKKDNAAQADREKVTKAAQKAADAAIGEAQNCLRSEQFQKYADEYEKTMKALFEELVEIDMTEFDPVRYGFRVKDVVAKMRHIGSLLRGVHQDAGKR